jgi:hypothetical protein
LIVELVDDHALSVKFYGKKRREKKQKKILHGVLIVCLKKFEMQYKRWKKSRTFSFCNPSQFLHDHKVRKVYLTLFWHCQNVPLLAKGEGRRRATG